MFEDLEVEKNSEEPRNRQVWPDPFIVVKIDGGLRDGVDEMIYETYQARINVYQVEMVRKLPDDRVEVIMKSGNRYTVDATLDDFDGWCKDIFYL